MEASVLDQIRLQEGRLFQSESIVALYLDTKAVINEMLLLETTDNLDDASVEMLKILSPKGIKDYHEKSLHECLKTVARLLWPGENLIIAKPKLVLLFKGMYRRILKRELYLDLDPIKQDFVIREAFRRTLVNDCLVVFEEQLEPIQENFIEAVDEIGPNDSASQVFLEERPPGARSVLNYKEDDKASLSQNEASDLKSVAKSAVKSVAERSDEKSVVKSEIKSDIKSAVKSVVRSTLRSTIESAIKYDTEKILDDGRSAIRSTILKQHRDTETVEPQAVTAINDEKSYTSRSVVSHASLKKPLNVRRVILEDEIK